MSKLTRLTWRSYRIPFKSPFVTAHGSLSYRQGALIYLQTSDGYNGLGEIAPLPEFGGHNLDRALGQLSDLAHELDGRELADIQRLLETQHHRLTSALICGMETAIFDILGQRSGRSMAALLSAAPATPRAIPINAVIGGSALSQTVQQAHAALAAGFSCVKPKVMGEEWSVIERVAAVRAALGSTPHLRLDANAGWDIDTATRILRECARYNIEYIEQPLPPEDIDGLACLRRISPIPVAADEALHSQASIRQVLDTAAADVLILKPQMNGGLTACRQFIQEASQRGIASVLTSTLETGVGVTAVLHLAAASPEITLACGLSTLDLLENDLLQDRPVFHNGALVVPTEPGLGVSLHPGALTKYVEGSA